MCHSPHPGDSLWLYCHEWDVANMNMLHERGTLYYPAIISQITETHNTAHNYIRPDTIISTPICFTGSQLRIFSFCLVLIHFAWDWVRKLFACSWYNWPMKHGWVDTPSSREPHVPPRLWQLQTSAGSAPCNQAPGGPSEVHSVPAPDTIGTNQQTQPQYRNL